MSRLSVAVLVLVNLLSGCSKMSASLENGEPTDVELVANEALKAQPENFATDLEERGKNTVEPGTLSLTTSPTTPNNIQPVAPKENQLIAVQEFQAVYQAAPKEAKAEVVAAEDASATYRVAEQQYQAAPTQQQSATYRVAEQQYQAAPTQQQSATYRVAEQQYQAAPTQQQSATYQVAEQQYQAVPTQQQSATYQQAPQQYQAVTVQKIDYDILYRPNQNNAAAPLRTEELCLLTQERINAILRVLNDCGNVRDSGTARANPLLECWDRGALQLDATQLTHYQQFAAQRTPCEIFAGDPCWKDYCAKANLL